METEKRKRVCDGEELDRKRGKTRGDDGENAVIKVAVPGDEEVDEFFSILRRIHVAVKYFQKRNAGGDSTAAPWNPAFERGDFAGAQESTEKSEQYHDAGSGLGSGLDLNSYPASEEKDILDSI